ncbi:MAG: hypothetical protein ABIH25_03185 [Candidatus Woesearchaeota archaeon]
MKERIESVERWAKYVKESNGKWKDIHTEFIDAQFQKADEFIKRLSKEKNGAEKIMKAYNIKNQKGYPALLKPNMRKV